MTLTGPADIGTDNRGIFISILMLDDVADVKGRRDTVKHVQKEDRVEEVAIDRLGSNIPSTIHSRLPNTPWRLALAGKRWVPLVSLVFV